MGDEPTWTAGGWDPKHTPNDDKQPHAPLGWNVNFETNNDSEVQALATNPMKLELPKVEPPKATCESGCDAYNKRQEEGCDHVRKRVALWLKQHGCPSIVKGYKKPPKCGYKKKTTKAKATASRSGRRR